MLENLTLSLAFILGVQHALETDHVAAVTTLNSGTKNIIKAAFKGALWGMGHTAALLAAGLLVLLLKITIPEELAASFEALAGIILVMLGMNALYKIRNEKLHIHRHRHDDNEHIHFHSHKYTQAHSHKHTPFFVGLAHGLAGSSSLILLVLAAAQSVFLGAAFILIFGIGSIIGMFLISLLLSVPFALAKRSMTNTLLQAAAASVSIIIGVSIMAKTGFALL